MLLYIHKQNNNIVIYLKQNYSFSILKGIINFFSVIINNFFFDLVIFKFLVFNLEFGIRRRGTCKRHSDVKVNSRMSKVMSVEG